MYKRNKMIGLLYCIFQAEGWVWGFKLPTYAEIEETVTELEKDAYNCKGTAETGRIVVHYDKDIDDYDYSLRLR